LLLGGEQGARKGAIPAWAGVWGPNAFFTVLGFAAIAARNTRARLTIPVPRFRLPRRNGDDEDVPHEIDRVRWGTGLWIGFPRIVDRLIVRDLARQFSFVTVGMTVVFLV